jgi:molybdenum cofactor cytidylyltransferase
VALEQGAVIAAPFHGDRRGHPVGFCASLRNELLALDGDVGARGTLDRHSNHITRVDVDDEGVLLDVDTPEDLKKL